jgi:hypothetical protein
MSEKNIMSTIILLRILHQAGRAVGAACHCSQSSGNIDGFFGGWHEGLKLKNYGMYRRLENHHDHKSHPTFNWSSSVSSSVHFETRKLTLLSLET